MLNDLATDKVDILMREDMQRNVGKEWTKKQEEIEDCRRLSHKIDYTSGNDNG
jgi:hypothetical protein